MIITYFNETLGGMDFVEASKSTKEIIGDSDVQITSIGLYCNPLQYEQQRKELEYCIENAPMYGHWYAPTCNIGFCPRA